MINEENASISDIYTEEGDVTVERDRSSRYRWASKNDYICNTVIHSMSLSQYMNFFGVTEDINLMHYVISILLLGMPLMYMEVLIGQYSQMCGLFMKNMCPLSHGIAYAALLLTILRSVSHIVMMSDFFIYMIKSFRTSPPWLNCANTKRCWEGASCITEEPCLSTEVWTAARIYWNETFLGGVPYNAYYKGCDFRRILIIILFLSILLVRMMRQSIFTMSWNKNVLIISLATVIANCLLLHTFCKDSMLALDMLLDITSFDVASLKQWVSAASNMIIMLNLGKGPHILYASYFPPTNFCAIYTVLNIVTIVLIALLYKLVFYVSLQCIVNTAKIDLKDYPVIVNPHEMFSLTVIPFGFRNITVNQLWSAIYFLGNFGFCINYVLVSLRFVDQSFIDVHAAVMKSYRRHFLVINSILCLLLAIMYAGEGMYMATFYYLEHVYDVFQFIIIFLFTITVSWIYGIQRLSDDIHFTLGAQPMKYWKVCWRISPILIGAILATHFENMYNSKYAWPTFLLLIVLSVPIIALAIYEMIKFMRRKNLLGVLQSLDTWGPSSTVGRMQRTLYNPRMSIKARRKSYSCNHKCLVISDVLKKSIVVENKARKDSSADINLETPKDTISSASRTESVPE